MSFTIYQASAGSGKTFSLAKEYLKIGLTDPEAYKNILAITFTNKAAAEMKNRILSYLTDIDSRDKASKGVKEILPKIIEELQIPEEVAVKNASKLLKNIIYNYADFSVMTIDSFFQRILRTFAYDLDIPLNFQLEIDHDEIIEQVVALLIDQIGENEDLTKMMIDFVHSSAEESKSWHIEKEIISFTPELFKEQSIQFIDTLSHLTLVQFTQIIQNFNIEKHDLKKELNSDIQRLQTLLTNQQIEIDGFYSNFLSKWIASIQNETYKISDTLKKVIKNENWFSKANEAKYLPALISIEVEFKEILNKTIAAANRILFISTIQKRIFPMALLNELKNMLSHIDSLEHTFHISNTNSRLNEITANEPAPFIYERLGDKYAYYFIDEFQDTSRLQWLNVLPLICEALSAYHGLGSGKAILFGDPKQAIYRFRGGDVAQFVSLPAIPNPSNNELISLMENTITHNFNSINLDTNYRSFGHIVTFNNDFFAHLVSKNSLLTELYLHHHQKFLASKTGGYITVSTYKKQETISFSEFTLNEIYRSIKSATESGFNYKDIAILTRDRGHAPEIADFLSNKGIPVISSESLLLTSSLKVLFILHLLQFTEQQTNQVLAYSIYVKFHQLFNPTIQLDFFPKIGSSLELEVCFKTHQFEFHFSQLNALNLYEKAEAIIRAFHFEAPADIYLLTFLNILEEKTISMPQEHKFWDWWNSKKETLSVDMPDDVNGITLLTIHKSKGLEFPIVIFPSFHQNNKKDDLWIPLTPKTSDRNQLLPVAKIKASETDDSDYSPEIERELANTLIDKVNTLYVALTRAVERLHIIVNTPPKNATSFSLSYEISDFANTSDLFKKEELNESINFYYGIAENKKSDTNTLSSNSIQLEKLNTTNWKENQWISAEYEDSEEQYFGNLFHFSMAMVQTFSDLDSALDYTQKAFNLDAELISKLKKMALLVINHEKLKSSFVLSNRTLNETEIVNMAGEILRPDRVVISDNIVTIIDYKTGTPLKKHEDQLIQYKNIFAELNYHLITAYIVYINEDNINVISV